MQDVIGHVTGVQHLEPKQIHQRVAQKRDVVIQNIRLFFRSTYCNFKLFFIPIIFVLQQFKNFICQIVCC